MPTLRLLALAGAFVLALAAPAVATGDLADKTLSAADKARLAAFVKTRAETVAFARQNGSGTDLAALEEILAGGPEPIRGVDLRGRYRCRTAKLDTGPGLPVIVYDWFECRIVEDDLGYHLDKTTGSQRVTMRFIDDSETRLVAYGADHYSDETPRRYDEDPDRNVVGYLVKAGEGRYRLEEPLPKLESKFDILELVKK